MSNPEYVIRGGDGRDYPADRATLIEWAQRGHLYPNQMVFSYLDDRWLMAQHVPVLRDVFAAQRAKQPLIPMPVMVGILITAVLGVVGLLIERPWEESPSDVSPTKVVESTSPEPDFSPEPDPQIGRGDREAHLHVLVSQMSPLFEDYEIVGPASVHVSVNGSAWNTLSRDQQRQLMDGLASKQIVRDIGATLHLRVMSTEVGTIGPGWSGEWKFRRAAD